ncbi:hypothetical protein J0H58_22430 [bacterium]|nr:hypothetical protein [bacterium]
MPRTLATLALLAGALGLSAARAAAQPPDKTPGQLDVFDTAKLFSPAGVAKAKEAFRTTSFHHGLRVTVDTVQEPPAAKKAAAEAAGKDAARWRAFMLEWARETAKEDRAKGVYVLVTLKPVGGVAVIADRETARRGFTDDDDRKVREIIATAFHDAKDAGDEAKQQEARSAGLLKAVEYIASDLKDTRVADAGPAAGGARRDDHKARDDRAGHQNPPATSPVMGYICMGLFALAGVWLVIGLIRMFSGGGGGAAGAGGPGGGGFFTSLLGGLFGAAAGMWLYSHFFGGGGMFGGGPDAYAGEGGGSGDVGDGGFGDTGAGDWGGGSGDAGGFDGGDAGGGDFGGDF